MPRGLSTSVIIVTFLVIFASRLYTPLLTKYIVAGFSRPRGQIINIHGERLVKIPNTSHCEDLHYHEPSNKLITACQNSKVKEARRGWFPPLGLFDVKHSEVQGSLVIIDPTDFTSTQLEFEQFDGPFISHGIDILHSPRFPDLLYIFAINHLAHPDASKPTQIEKAASQVEIFSHTIGSKTARHLYSITHPKIRTPNDILATSTTSFYVTNDHYYRSGPLRTFEDLGWRGIAGWTDTQHVSIDPIEKMPWNASSGVSVTTALKGLHNNNGLGRGETADIVLIGSAASGELTRAKRNLESSEHPELEILEHIQLDTTIDNPTYFHDKYATTGNDASGYIVAGLSRAIDIHDDLVQSRPMPVTVWHVQRNATIVARGGPLMRGEDAWMKNVIFQDDGREASAAATALMIGVDPKEANGKKKGWLFITGFLSDNVVATLVDL